LCHAHLNAGQLVIGKSGSPPRCAAVPGAILPRTISRYPSRENFRYGCHCNAAGGEVRRLGVRSYSAAFSSAQDILEVEGRRASKRLAGWRDLGWSSSIKKMDRGKKTGDLRDDFINVLGCRGIKVFDEVAWLEGAACEFGDSLFLTLVCH